MRLAWELPVRGSLEVQYVEITSNPIERDDNDG
jgi:hypothetical protein